MTASYPILHAAPPATRPPRAPAGPSGLRAEWRSVLVPGRLLAHAPSLLTAPKGDGGPVFDIPGWKAPEASMAPLRSYLRRIGHDAVGWGLGTNHGNPERDSDILAGLVQRRHEATGRPVALIGWSLGGVIAREVARLVPDDVQQVVTYGTPVVGGPAYTIGASSYPPAEVHRITELLAEFDRSNPIRVPITSIFSRRDAVVDWVACIDRVSPSVEHVEVGSTHASMGLDPHVWRVVAQRLDPAIRVAAA